MKTPAPSFLGKKVFSDQEKQRYYVIKYEDQSQKKTVDVLLFDHEVPVIFATMDYDGQFLDSFFLSNKTTKASGEALERYKQIQARKQQHRVTQDDLKDALKSESEAKMKNPRIQKLLRDEHLEDIKNQWPSRLIALQREMDGADDSLIMEALFDALETANSKKAYSFLKAHRLDQLIPPLALDIVKHPELLELAMQDYFYANEGRTAAEFLGFAAETAPLEDTAVCSEILTRADQLEREFGNGVLRNTLVEFSRRIKQSSFGSMKEWLQQTVDEPSLKQAIVQTMKKKTS
ncbi:hypothetical protein [Alkalicoccus urumqiensis]|uniref:Uncharacterized protein n=1 Tax=Alkalicoccus urumqiensis TaxID=1548213 RepID=A0A2P6MGQ6_ALKUR|nr:hypothetical protein [Alkalicoccus urumqiensis]PRO65469.1 hypothetical protein C6I21_09955 [Alkalicoccus urumqiensis]